MPSPTWRGGCSASPRLGRGMQSTDTQHEGRASFMGCSGKCQVAAPGAQASEPCCTCPTSDWQQQQQSHQQQSSSTTTACRHSRRGARPTSHVIVLAMLMLGIQHLCCTLADHPPDFPDYVDRYLLEGSPLEVPTLSGSWVTIGSLNFTVYFQPLPYDQAATYCSSVGSSLASFRTVEDFLSVSQFLLRSVDDCWIGLNISTNGTWQNVSHWSDGNPVAYTHWAADQPSDSTGDCALISTDVDSIDGTRVWASADCGAAYAFLCKSQVGGNGLPSPPLESPFPFPFASPSPFLPPSQPSPQPVPDNLSPRLSPQSPQLPSPSPVPASPVPSPVPSPSPPSPSPAPAPSSPAPDNSTLPVSPQLSSPGVSPASPSPAPVSPRPAPSASPSPMPSSSPAPSLSPSPTPSPVQSLEVPAGQVLQATYDIPATPSAETLSQAALALIKQAPGVMATVSAQAHQADMQYLLVSDQGTSLPCTDVLLLQMRAALTTALPVTAPVTLTVTCGTAPAVSSSTASGVRRALNSMQPQQAYPAAISRDASSTLGHIMPDSSGARALLRGVQERGAGAPSGRVLQQAAPTGMVARFSVPVGGSLAMVVAAALSRDVGSPVTSSHLQHALTVATSTQVLVQLSSIDPGTPVSVDTGVVSTALVSACGLSDTAKVQYMGSAVTDAPVTPPASSSPEPTPAPVPSDGSIQPPATSGSQKGMSAGAVAGIVVGVMAALAALGALYSFMSWMQKQRQLEASTKPDRLMVIWHNNRATQRFAVGTGTPQTQVLTLPTPTQEPAPVNLETNYRPLQRAALYAQ